MSGVAVELVPLFRELELFGRGVVFEFVECFKGKTFRVGDRPEVEEGRAVLRRMEFEGEEAGGVREKSILRKSPEEVVEVGESCCIGQEEDEGLLPLQVVLG